MTTDTPQYTKPIGWKRISDTCDVEEEGLRVCQSPCTNVLLVPDGNGSIGSVAWFCDYHTKEAPSANIFISGYAKRGQGTLHPIQRTCEVVLTPTAESFTLSPRVVDEDGPECGAPAEILFVVQTQRGRFTITSVCPKHVEEYKSTKKSEDA